jgi:hypothetical protein
MSVYAEGHTTYTDTHWASELRDFQYACACRTRTCTVETDVRVLCMDSESVDMPARGSINGVDVARRITGVSQLCVGWGAKSLICARVRIARSLGSTFL